MGEEPKIPNDLQKLSPDSISKLGILTPGVRDYLNSPQQIAEFTRSDGLVQAMSIFQPQNILTVHGVPASLQVHGDIKSESVKKALYREPVSGKLQQCVYLEIEEPTGEIGKGGINGLILPQLPVVILTDKTMYLIGFDLLGGIEKEAFDPNLLPPKRDQKHMPFIQPMPGRNLPKETFISV